MTDVRLSMRVCNLLVSLTQEAPSGRARRTLPPRRARDDAGPGIAAAFEPTQPPDAQARCRWH